MKVDRKDLLLYAVTDRSWLGDKTLAGQVEEAIKGGASFVQFREKHLEGEDFLKEAKAVQAVCRAHGVPFVVNDNVSAAKELDADGVHVGQSDMEAGNVRSLLGPDKIIGVSAHSVEEALLAEARGADYLGVGAAFATGSKNDASVLPHETIAAICRAVKIPVIAIGGITAENVKELKGSGICGVAVISTLFAAKDVEASAEEMKKQTEKMLGKEA